MKSTRRWTTARAWLTALPFAAAAMLAAQTGRAAAQTENLAYIDSLTVVNGGTFPTTDPAFAGYNFVQLPIADITASNIGPGGVCGANGCDTILLNVASTGIACNIAGTLTTTQEQTLVDFVNGGGKLLIFDSECDTQDYSWLPYTFMTANPGQLGASGTLTIVENNALGSDNSSDPSYIDANVLASQTDAIGDMNVMTTQDANWCLSMSGTNAIPVTGPVLTYARYGSGLFVYNGMDLDTLSSSTTPDTGSGSGNLAKIWLQELEVPFNPTPTSDLPCGATVVGITLAPPSATNDLTAGETMHTVTATVEDLLGNPQPDIPVTFDVTSGPNAGATGTCDTGSNCATNTDGEVQFTYTSNSTTGTDEIVGCYTPVVPAAKTYAAAAQTSSQQCSQPATVTWIRSAPPPPSGQNVVVNGTGGSGAFSPLWLIAGLLLLGLRRRR